MAGSGRVRVGRKPLWLTESGLYSLILTSLKPEAKRFKKWVTGEVLPEIRKRGYYSVLEVELQKQKERLLEEHFPGLPGPSKRLAASLIERLLRKFGWAPASGARVEAKRGNPPWGTLLANWLYEWSCRIPGQQEHRRSKNPAIRGKDNRLRVPFSRSDQGMLSEEAEASFKEVCSFGALLVETAASWEDWRNKMELTFGTRPLQLPIVVPVLVERAKP